MCGLVGVFSKSMGGFNQEQQALFHTLLFIDALRGEDSTGAFLVHLNGDMTLAKEASTSAVFQKSAEYRDLQNLAFRQGAAMIGHNRKATKGTIKDENAHPFVVDDKIVLVHNGGIWGEHKQHADVEVDSHAIAHLLKDHPDKPEEALAKFHGAYALIWYDVEKEQINLIRNKERPLWWMETENAWIWSSEREQLVFAGMREGVKVKENPVMLAEDTLVTYSLKHRKLYLSTRKVEIDRSKLYEQGSTKSGGHSAFYPIEGEWEGALACGPRKDCAYDSGTGNETDAASNDGGKLVDKDNEVVLDARLTIPAMLTMGQAWVQTSTFEANLAISTNKLITQGEFRREVVPSFPFGKPVLCTAFEFVGDGNGGWYLYAYPDEDPTVIFRHHFVKEAKIPLNRMLVMTANEWKLNMQVDAKAFCDSPEAELKGDLTEGYALITTHSATIVKGGGVQMQQEKMNA